MRSNALRRALAGVFALVTIPAAVLMATSATASAAALPILHASNHGEAHVCQVIGDDGTYRAVVCIDLWSAPDGSGQYASGEEAEMYCQRMSNLAYVQCADVTAVVGFASGTGAGDTTYSFHVCGHTAGNCSATGRNYAEVNPNLVFSNADTSCTTLGTANEEWAVLLGGTPMVGTAPESKIELPGSDKVVLLDANFETGHYFICP